MRVRSTVVCGVDEAGRGPLAGPVYAAAVILGRGVKLDGLADSKTLTAAQREALRPEIQAKALAWAVASASVAEIDNINILQATLLAMRRAVEQLLHAPGEILIDGLHCPVLRYPARAIVRGDATVAEISAASILAKTARDQHMLDLDARFPAYGFAQNKGYSTREHIVALRRHGASPVHRQTFAPVREVVYSLF